MDQEIKQEFQTLRQDIEDLAIAVANGFQSIEERMATKDELKTLESKMATKDELKTLENRLENKMDAEFSSVRSELRNEIGGVRKDIKDLREEVKNNFKTETEDVGAISEDVEDLKRRMVLVEARP